MEETDSAAGKQTMPPSRDKMFMATTESPRKQNLHISGNYS